MLVWAEGRSACPRGISFCGIKGGYSSPMVSFNLPPPYIWDQRCRDEAPRLLSSPDRAQQLLTHTQTCFHPSITLREAGSQEKKKRKKRPKVDVRLGGNLFCFLRSSRAAQARQVVYISLSPRETETTQEKEFFTHKVKTLNWCQDAFASHKEAAS